MATTTPRLGLTKPDLIDLVDVGVLNTNFDKIDAASAQGTIVAQNYLINGGMDINQRNNSAIMGNGFRLDRWYVDGNSAVTQDSTLYAPGTRYSMKVTVGSAPTVYSMQVIETAMARQLAGKTVTLSVYAASNGPTSNLNMALQYSTTVDAPLVGAWTSIDTYVKALSGTMDRWVSSYNVPANAQTLRVIFYNPTGFTSGQAYYLSGAQLELGSVSTAFRLNANSIAGELAACQRYYYQQGGVVGLGSAASSGYFRAYITLPVPLRRQPDALQHSGLIINDEVTNYAVGSAYNYDLSNPSFIRIEGTASGLTTYRPHFLYASSYVAWNAEL